MSQDSDYTLSSGISGSAQRVELNAILGDIRTLNSGSSAPVSPVANMLWLDTSNATSPVLKLYDGADWITIGTFNFTTNTFVTGSSMAYDWSTNYVTTAGTSTAYTAALTPARTGYTTGEVIAVKANATNTGACTISVNGLTAKSIYKYGSQELLPGDIKANQLILLGYNGSSFELLNPPASEDIIASSTFTAQATVDFTDICANINNLDDIEIEFKSNTVATDADQIVIQTSANTGGSPTFNTGGAEYRNTNGTPTGFVTADGAFISLVNYSGSSGGLVGNAAGESFSGKVTLHTPKETSNQKKVNGLTTWNDTGGNIETCLVGSERNSTSAINAIRVKTSSGGNFSGTIILRRKRGV